jgi:hypothetical protein
VLATGIAPITATGTAFGRLVGEDSGNFEANSVDLHPVLTQLLHVRIDPT